MERKITILEENIHGENGIYAYDKDHVTSAFVSIQFIRLTCKKTGKTNIFKISSTKKVSMEQRSLLIY